jgi:hypothetical protein
MDKQAWVLMTNDFPAGIIIGSKRYVIGKICAKHSLRIATTYGDLGSEAAKYFKPSFLSQHEMRFDGPDQMVTWAEKFNVDEEETD